MLSRVANSIYWMARYLERADNVSRFIRVNVHLMLDLGLSGGSTQWAPLIRTSGDEATFSKYYTDFNQKNVIQFLTFDPRNPNSICACIEKARENARTVRDVIPSELWEAINALYHLVQKYSRKKRIGDLQEFFTEIRNANHHFTGLMDETMSHGQGWHFARLGKYLERADKTARMLDVKYFLLLPNTEYVDSPYDAVEWGAVLKSANAFEMYRKQFHRVNYKDVTQFLVFDQYFPRSVTYCITTAASSLSHIASFVKMKKPAQDEMAELASMLKRTDGTEVLANGLHEFIDIFQFNLNVVDNAIYESFFAPQEAVEVGA